MFLAESSSLDGLITMAQLMFASTALPRVCGFFLPRFKGVAIFLGAISILAGLGLLGWMISERASVLGFYLAAGTPLVVGAAACLRASLFRGKPEVPSGDSH